ncbi:type IV conjugative transfer system protein TraE [Psittacicella gerlachiana]|nr:type IV conjugative transfer system protein TraE [Psittacicella gerlachiana]
MKFKQWQTQVKRLKSHTSLLLLTNLVLGISLALSIYWQATSKPLIIVQPMVAHDKLELKAQSLTRSYAVSFATSMAILLGNVTADNGLFVLESISQYVAPDYYAQFRKQLVADMQRLKEKRMDMTFVITQAYFYETSQEVVVEGIATIIDAAGNRLQNPHQFRMRLDLVDYVPRIRQLQSLSLAKD